MIVFTDGFDWDEEKIAPMYIAHSATEEEFQKLKDWP